MSMRWTAGGHRPAVSVRFLDAASSRLRVDTRLGSHRRVRELVDDSAALGVRARLLEAHGWWRREHLIWVDGPDRAVSALIARLRA